MRREIPNIASGKSNGSSVPGSGAAGFAALGGGAVADGLCVRVGVGLGLPGFVGGGPFDGGAVGGPGSGVMHGSGEMAGLPPLPLSGPQVCGTGWQTPVGAKGPPHVAPNGWKLRL